ncbi:Zinc ion binding isoform 2 [Hibiscus syriacus]|uniref:Zinc ion binding isoform 2 n=1 Tax=Hibiscus syriacus TaxID=106335 RepID=A0A6A3ARL1_HIBSY|nr:Zinc ion binding isoform 2 [Hibiscus syriacus]
MNLGDLHKVWEIKTLKRKPGEEEAKKILEKIAKQVQPIMRKHKWRVKLLSEFCPNNPRLLGLNVGGGIHVKLRLRRPNRDWDFYPFDQVLDTMLHELCHNVHGPHNASFYRLWDELRKGRGLIFLEDAWVDFPDNSTLVSLPDCINCSGEQSVLGVSITFWPKLLGGDSTIKNALSPVQAAAMAAERRLQDDIWCGSHCSKIAEDEESADTLHDHLDTDQGAERSGVKDASSRSAFGGTSHKRSHGQDKPKSNFVDLTTPPVSGSAVNQDAKSLKRSCKSNNLISSSSSSSVPVLNDDSPEKRGETSMWECKSCTLLNPPLAPICEVASRKAPRHRHQVQILVLQLLHLGECVKLDKCSACDRWRYSHGPPISTPAPNVGT